MTNKNKKQEFDGLLLGTRIEKILEENYILDYEREIYSYQRKVWQWIEKKDQEQLDKIIKMIEGGKKKEKKFISAEKKLLAAISNKKLWYGKELKAYNQALEEIITKLKKKQLTNT